MTSRVRTRIVRLQLVALLFVAAFSALPAAAQSSPRLFTYSTLDALLAGVYDGDLTLRELGTKGDFGIGTYNRLDGEMILLDGVFYHARVDGSVVVAVPDERTPLAYVTQFRRSRMFKVESTLTLQQLESWLDARLENLNLFYAIRIDGQFREASTRAIAPQNKPYKPLAEVVATQSVHDYSGRRGVLVAFRSPAFSKGISVPGYHWHFLTDDRKHGGHVLRLTLAEGTVSVEAISDLDLRLPRTRAFAAADQSKDRTQDTRRVEGN